MTVQVAVLEALAGVEARPVLTGGGCLAGFHLAHRDKRDLDLFFRDQTKLGPALLSDIEVRLRDASLAFEVITRSPGFVRYLVERHGERAVVDLVAELVRGRARREEADRDCAGLGRLAARGARQQGDHVGVPRGPS
jgi:hypothetical protein